MFFKGHTLQIYQIILLTLHPEIKLDSLRLKR